MFHWYIIILPGVPKLGGLRFRFRQNKKAWELTSHSSHSLRPSHCPALLNEQRRSPRRYVYTFPNTDIDLSP